MKDDANDICDGDRAVRGRLANLDHKWGTDITKRVAQESVRGKCDTFRVSRTVDPGEGETNEEYRGECWEEVDYSPSAMYLCSVRGTRTSNQQTSNIRTRQDDLQ